jgi:pimeloyl-ACP methyl ester carboxylesterase
MPYFENNGIKIYYEIEGEGPPVVMIHGLTGNIEESWRQTNWVEKLKDHYQLILLDCRGHGKSDKPHDSSYYGKKMVDEVIKLLEHLSIDKANIFGYSMGANITFQLLMIKPEIIICAILGGFVLSIKEKEIAKNLEAKKQMIEGFKAENVSQVRKPMARIFRMIAEAGDNDLLALAAERTGSIKNWYEILATPAQRREALKNIKVPVMTVASSELLQGDKTLLAQLVQDACHFQIQGKDHSTMIPDPKFQMVVKAFLDLVNK